MESYGKVGQDVDFRLLHFRTYGAEWIKEKAKLSPDSYVQMALQLAYYKLYHTGTLPRDRFPEMPRRVRWLTRQNCCRDGHVRDWPDEAVLPRAYRDRAFVLR